MVVDQQFSTGEHGDMGPLCSQRPMEDAGGTQQLSGPFQNMCLASQQNTKASRIPMFHDEVENVPRYNSSQGVLPLHQSQKGGLVASQAMISSMMSQDFVTPADQFDVGNDLVSQRAAGTLVRQRSPAAMSPARMKKVNRIASPGSSAFGPTQKPAIAPCYRSAFSDNVDEEKTLMGWQSQGVVIAPGSTGSRYKDDFKETGMLGQGSFCKVHSARHKLDGNVYAIKRTLQGVTRQSPEFAQFLQEVQILSNVPYHQGIIRYYSSWTESSGSNAEKLYIQLEAGTTTVKNLSFANPLPEKVLVEIARQVLSALVHLHHHGIAHMDIKPSNIIIVRKSDDEDDYRFKPGEIKLCDFGLATGCRKLKGNATQEMSVQEGDACYLPLEVMNSDYSELYKADVFALGATLYELASGNDVPSGGQLYEDLRRNKVPLLPNITTTLMQVIRLMMRHDSKERPSAQKLLSMAPFFATQS